MKRNEKKLNETERTQRREEEKKHTGVIWVLRSSARPQADGELKNRIFFSEDDSKWVNTTY